LQKIHNEKQRNILLSNLVMNCSFTEVGGGPKYAPIMMLIKATTIANRGAMCILK